MTLPQTPGPIGIFDSGYGGLTILHGIRQQLPQYDYLYLGDNARAPYGPRSFDVVYEFTRQAVLRLFEMGCHLVILGCNTASAKALRTIQQRDLPQWDPNRRVLGIIRPTAEVIGDLTNSRHVGILATEGTIRSESYNLEIQKLYPDIDVSGVACPFWVPLVEYNEADSPGADYPTTLSSCLRYLSICQQAYKLFHKENTWLIVLSTICHDIQRWRANAPRTALCTISPPRILKSSRSLPRYSFTSLFRSTTSHWAKTARKLISRNHTHDQYYQRQ